MAKMSIAELKERVQQAKQAQAASQANENIREHVGEHMIVVGIHITTDINIKSAGLILDKVTYALADGTAMDGFHLAATESAESLIEYLGEGPFEPALVMEIKEIDTKRGLKQYAELIGIYDPDSTLGFKEMMEEADAAEAAGDAAEAAGDDPDADPEPDPQDDPAPVAPPADPEPPAPPAKAKRKR